MEGFITWRDEWLSGIEILDEQHRLLADSLNRLVGEYTRTERSESGPEDGRQELLQRLFGELHARARTHFRNEEAMMLSEQYPDYAAHAREHLMLLAELKSTFDRSVCGAAPHLDTSILRALKFWFIGHVSRSDRAFADYVTRRTGGCRRAAEPDSRAPAG